MADLFGACSLEGWSWPGGVSRSCADDSHEPRPPPPPPPPIFWSVGLDIVRPPLA